ncbi:MAG: T9SS type A sorting domain-containing protein [Bacteroidia bacterium]|nr:T9SS type A sorting domain-containing protein [Bacteroidia bacterium]MCZ2140035.1 T9SS type A sorting domain-containing protein [Bacteroidia bacterium]
MAGNNVANRYIIYYNPDTIFLNVNQSGIWTRKIAYTGDTINSATLSFYKDTIWICWKEGNISAQIKAMYTSDKGNSWSSVIPVSLVGKVAAPSIYAAKNGKIHFVWSMESKADTTVYYNVYSNGSFLDSPYPLSNLTGQGEWPSVIAIGDTVLSAWREGPPPTKIWFRSSFNGGRSWNSLSPIPTTTLLPISKDPNLAYAYDSTINTHYVYIVFDGQNLIYLQRSIDFGNSWSIPDTISNLNKWSQFAHIECNNKGFVGISYEQRPIGSSLYDDTKKDVGFTYSTNWGNSGSFSVDTLAYAHNGFGSAYPAFNKIDDNNFYLAWLTKDKVNNKMNVLERLIHFSNTTGINAYEQNINPRINIFPNPFSTQTTLQTNMNFKNTTLNVYNFAGQTVKQIDNFAGQTILFNRDNLPNGLYYIQLKQDNNVIFTDKIIITD